MREFVAFLPSWLRVNVCLPYRMKHVLCMRPTCRVCLPRCVPLTHVQETGCRASANSTVWLSPLKYGVPLVEVTWLGRETARSRFLPDMAGPVVDCRVRFLPDLAGPVSVCRVCIDCSLAVQGYSWVT